MMSIAAPFVSLSPSYADVGFAVVPLFPPVLTVGQTGVPASISISNASTGVEATGPVTVTDITLVPSCGQFAPSGDCPGPSIDPDVFALSPTGVGEAGTACAGQVFTITNIDQVQDKYTFTPVGGPVVLQPPGTPGDLCRINFTLTVLKTPTKDAFPAQPGIQTTRVAAGTGISNVTGAPGFSAQTGFSTVNPATPTIATLVSPPLVPPAPIPTVNLGQSFTDTATVTGVANGPTPTGSVTFAYVFDAPGVAPCTGPTTVVGPAPLAPSVPPTVPPSATATSAPVTATAVGTYHFIATYTGDANYTALAATACNAPGENVMVVATPTLVTLAASSNPAAPPGTAIVPETVTDTATVTGVAGGPTPTGTVTFTRYFDAPGAAPCSGPATVIGPVPLVPVAPATNPPTATATTPAFAPTGPGTVRFTASYSGDVSYSAVPTTPCGAAGENVTVQAPAGLVTLAASSNPAAPAGTATTADTVTDTATVTGALNGPVPTGTVTFTQYFDAPGAAPCSGPATVIGPVALAPAVPGTNPPTAIATTPAFAPPGPGTVRYTASYSGDANYTAVPTTPCGAPGENVTVIAMPTLVTLAASSNAGDPAGTAGPGATVSDTATVTGSLNGPAPTGTVTFTRFFDAPGAAPCSGPATVIGPVALAPVAPATNPPTATASTPAFLPPGPGTVRFLASYSGDANYAPIPNTPCGAPGENVTVTGLPTLVTLAASSNPADPAGTAGPGATVTDTATVTGTAGGPAPTGTVTFTRFFDAPGAAPCSGAPTVLAPVALVPVAPATIPPSSTASTPAFAPPGPGTVRFLASYSGDANYVALPNTPCGAPGENVTIQATPSLVTLAASSNPANPPGTAGPGATVTDTATVTGVAGGPAPTGTVTFTRFFDAPGAALCSGPSTVIGPLTLAPVAPAPVPPASTVTTPAFTPPGPGTVRYLASYSGDTFYAPLPNTPCGAAGENVTVIAGPSIVTLAASSNPARPAGTAAIGDSVSDTATVTGAVGAPAPTGTVTFTRFFDPPGAAPCSTTPTVLAPVALTAVAPATIPPSATATSPAFTVPGPGTVRFLASYSGDANYAPIPNTPCDAPGESVTVAQTQSGIVTVAALGAGNAVTDTVTVSGINPTGTVTFRLYNNETCTGTPVFQQTKTLVPGTVANTATATTDPFVLPAAGIYHFVATYSGDANNLPAGPTPCLDAAETVGAGVLAVQLTTDASDSVSVGQPIFDVATLTASVPPTGVITFQLYGPDNNTCSGVPIFTSNRTVTGNGSYTSESFTPTLPGTYRWIAIYSGDPSNASAITQCLDPLESVVVTPLPTIGIVKTATPPSLPVPGGTFTFPVTVTNTGTIPVTITSLTDNIYGDVTTIPGSTCNTAIGVVLAPSPGPGHTYSCSFPGTFFGPAGAAQTDIVTVTGVDARGNVVRAADDAIVTITPLPTISVDKQATPPSRPVPGGTFTFPVVVTNTSNVPLTIRTLTDNIYGDVTRIPGSTCANAIGVILAPSPGPGNTYSCSFQGTFFGPAGAAQTDIVTVTAVDNRGNAVQASDDAIVRITPLPAITTTKTPSPNSLPEPGGTFTFDYSVTNTGPETVTITSIVDDVYGDLNGRGTCVIGARLVPGATYRCSFTGNFFGNAGASQIDTITTTARDDRGQTVTSQAQAIVRITDVLPTIRVDKSPNPVSRPEPGGSFRFTVVVTNTSFEPVTITSLVDDIYGDLNGRGSCAIGARLAPNGGAYSCAFDGEFRGRAGDSQTDTVTAGAVDDEGNLVTAFARATVFLTPVGTPPVVPPPVVQPPPPAPPLVRTGSELASQARLAGLFLLVGMTLIAATRNFGEEGPGLAPVPAGPGGGPRGPGSGGGGHWFGDNNWFGGARVHPPRGPIAGLGAEAPAPAPPPPVPDDVGLAWDVFARPKTWVARPPVTELEPAPAPEPEAVVADQMTGIELPAVLPEPQVEVLQARIVADDRPDTVAPPVVPYRPTGGLDAAALDAAQAMAAPVPPPSGPAGRRRGRRP